MTKIQISTKAEEDLFEIWHYIAVQNSSAQNADQFLGKIENEFYKIAGTPNIGANRNYLFDDLRVWPLGSYLIYYLPRKTDVLIVRILHGSRDIDLITFH